MSVLAPESTNWSSWLRKSVRGESAIYKAASQQETSQHEAVTFNGQVTESRAARAAEERLVGAAVSL